MRLQYSGTILLALALTGCASSPASLQKYGDIALDGNNIKSAAFKFDKPAQPSGLTRCVATIVRNGSVAMSQNGGFVGAYTGTYYMTSSSTATAPDAVIRFVSPDGSQVVATGETKYVTGMVERSVKFTLTANETPAGREYRYTTIEQAGTNNGYGYQKVHTMPGGGADNVMATLKKLSTELDSCL